jgi:hypothetical protein
VFYVLCSPESGRLGGAVAGPWTSRCVVFWGLLIAVIAQKGIGRAKSARSRCRTTSVAFAARQELTGPQLLPVARAANSGQTSGPWGWRVGRLRHHPRRELPCAARSPARIPAMPAGARRGLGTRSGMGPSWCLASGVSPSWRLASGVHPVVLVL